MKMHGIKFNNRTKSFGSDAEDPARMNAQFCAFASLCESIGVAKHVRGVEYSSNWCTYEIDVDVMHKHNDVGGGIEWAADQTLTQFAIFGRVEHKGGLEHDV